MIRRVIFIGILFLSFALTGCELLPWFRYPEEAVMVRVKPGKWPNLADDLDKASLYQAMEQSRVYLRRLPPDRTFRFGPDSYSAQHLLVSLDAFEKLYRSVGTGKPLTRALKQEFIFYKSVGKKGRGEVICTGYYEPLLKGSLKPGGNFRWPLYKKPDDLIQASLGDFSPDLAGKAIKGRLQGRKLVPYYTRSDIERKSALAGRNLELVWVDDPISLLFLHIQGSGRVQLPDGKIMQVGYAESNGRPYRSLGQRLLELDLISQEEMSMQAIRKWLVNHPEKAMTLMDYNESYIFFRSLENGPLGNINVPLTSGRSVALDHRIFPKGALAWLQCRKPVIDSGRIERWEEFSRLVMVQDTGGAIRGPGRLDLFFGHGVEAEIGAGHMKESGRLFFLVMKTGKSQN
ncbi:MAG: murein transglycosylase A [Deltaproteobacteria bacterium]|nr:murein transglycosylase A [Deltaproteobacteria bacterium]